MQYASSQNFMSFTDKHLAMYSCWLISLSYWRQYMFICSYFYLFTLICVYFYSH